MKTTFPLLVGALLLAFSCSTSPSAPTSGPASRDTAPDWIGQSTFVDGPNLVFVITGPETSDLPSLSLKAMTAWLNLAPRPDAPYSAVQALNRFLAQVSATAPSAHYTKGTQGWWKVAVDRASWDASRAQLKALLDAPADPVGDLEQAAADLRAQGRYFEAASSWVAAAAASVAEGRPVQVSRFKANLAQVKDILSQMTLNSPTAAQTTQVGQPLGVPFDVVLTFGSGAGAPALAGVPLRFSYLTKTNGRLATTGTTVVTDAQGRARLELPTPHFAARDSVVVLVDTSAWAASLAKVPKDLTDAASAVGTWTGERRIQIPYTVESASKQVALYVALADFDDKGALARRQETTAALISGLQKAGFQAQAVMVNPTLLKSPKESVILTAWRFQGKKTGRAVYGTVDLVSVGPSESQFRAEVTGTVKVVDLATGDPVYQTKTTKVALAADRTTAISQGFRQWGAATAELLSQDLP